MTQWPEKFITPARALDLAGRAMLYLSIQPTGPDHDAGPGIQQVHLCCCDCGQSVMLLASAISLTSGRLLSPEEVLSAALRHRVMAHDLVLSGAGNG